MLNEAELNNSVCEKIREHLIDRLQVMRKKNDSQNLDEIKTAHLRGEIHEIKKLLALVSERPETGFIKT